MNAQDEDFAKRKAEYDRAQANNATEIAAAKRNYDILVQDEQGKAQSCKLCPYCGKIVWKLDGCNSMTCGRDASDKGGGNVQNGCGKQFNWGTAASYVPNIGQAPTPQELRVAAPQEAQKVKHEIFAGESRKCDICQDPIVGPLIKCLNCPAFYYCLKCNSTNRKHWASGQSHVGVVYFENRADV
jgi:regulator of protease activity HflC (stomatin/prohibitin superfamily)